MVERIKVFCNVQETLNENMTVKELVQSKTRTCNSYKRLKECLRQQRAQLRAIKARQRKAKRQQMSDSAGTPTATSSSDVTETSSDEDCFVTNLAYCYYCDCRDAQIQRHYKRKHSQEPEVAEILALPASESKLRRKKMIALRNKGNWLKGKRNLKTGNPSELVQTYVRTDGSQPKSKMVICQYCHKALSTHYIAKHLKSGRCVEIDESNDQEIQEMPGRDFVRSARRESFVDIDDEDAKDVLMTMNDDDTTRLIRSDPQLRHYFYWLVEKYKRQGCWRTLKGKARDCARFLLFVRQQTESSSQKLSSIWDCLQPQNWSQVKKLCIEWAGIDDEGSMVLASRPKRAGEVLFECCDRAHNEAIAQGVKEDMDLLKRWKQLA